MNRLLVSILMVLFLSLPLIQSPAVAADSGGTATPQVCGWQMFYNDQGELADASQAAGISSQQLLTNLCNSRFGEQGWTSEQARIPPVTFGPGTVTAAQPSQGPVPAAGAGTAQQVCASKLFYNDQGELNDASTALGLSPQQLLINLCNSRFGEQGWKSQEVQSPPVTFGPGTVTAAQPSQGPVPAAGAGTAQQVCTSKLFYNDQGELNDASTALGLSPQDLLTDLCNSRFGEQAWTSQ